MALGTPQRKKSPLGVFIMVAGLVLAAFFGAAAGLVWQSSSWADDEPEEENVTAEAAPA